MDLRTEGKILYVTPFDVSIPNGPGVNELEFIGVLERTLGERAHYLLPKPLNDLDKIPNVTYSCGHRKYHPIYFVLNELSQIRVANALLRKYQFDFLVFRLGILPLAAAHITRRYQIPYAIKTLSVGAFDAFGIQSGVKNILGRSLAPVNERLYRRLTAHAAAIDVCTEAAIGYFSQRLSLGPERIRCIGNATNVERFYPMERDRAREETGLRAFDPIVGFVGGRAWTRGGAQLLEITPWLLERFPGLAVVIVGGGGGVEELRKRAAELGVQAHCVFTGVVPYDRVPGIINSFDVCVAFDLKSNTDRFGNASQKVRQYVACGKPVVSGPGGNTFLERAGLGSIVEADDLVGIREATARWLSLSKGERQTHSEKAVNYARASLTVEKALSERLDYWNTSIDPRR